MFLAHAVAARADQRATSRLVDPACQNRQDHDVDEPDRQANITDQRPDIQKRQGYDVPPARSRWSAERPACSRSGSQHAGSRKPSVVFCCLALGHDSALSRHTRAAMISTARKIATTSKPDIFRAPQTSTSEEMPASSMRLLDADQSMSIVLRSTEGREGRSRYESAFILRGVAKALRRLAR